MAATLLINAMLARCTQTQARGDVDALQPRGAALVQDDRIAWVGDSGALPATPPGTQIIDCGGRLLTPGFIDCHTHLVYAGNRAGEFALRQQGASYAQIAEAGGGIAGTVAATRAASATRLMAETQPRLDAIMSGGVTTIEIKSGYGLDLDTECRLLEVARAIGMKNDITVRTTFLGAHAVAPEFIGRPDDYLDHLCQHMLPAAHSAGLVDAVDVFIESIAFSPDQARRVFDCARQLGLPVKAHAEQLSASGATRTAVACGALSVDHLEYLPTDDVPLLSQHGTVAVLLPGAFHFLGETQLPPVGALRAHRIPMAIATDANPGTSPVCSLLSAMTLGCTLFGLTPLEALFGVTVNAARALGLQHRVGTLKADHQADLVLWDVHDPAELCYQLGLNPCHAVMIRGNWRQPPDRSIIVSGAGVSASAPNVDGGPTP